MKPADLTLFDWQSYLERFRRANWDAKPGACFRIDGTQFSTARFFGGFTYNGGRYTVFGYGWTGGDAGALIGVREDMLRWVVKKCKEAAQ